MNPLFRQLIGQAAQLTSRGDLQAATAAIQEALGLRASPVQARSACEAVGGDVIDVEAREVTTPVHAHGLPHGLPLWAGEAAREARASGAANAEKRPIGEGRVTRGTYSCAHGQRDWRLYVPPHATAGDALPLVVMLHGCTQDPDDFAAGTGMDEAARAQGFFVLYPAQSQKANPQRCWNWFKHNHQQRDHGEPALIAGMTREVLAQHAVDARRVYVAGLSAGGAMAAILGEAYPDLYAAVGVHSGLPAGAANDLPSALSAMKGGSAELPIAHGLADLPGMPSAMQRVPAAKKRSPRKEGKCVPTIVFHGDLDHTVHPINAEHIVAACVPPAANDEAKPQSGCFSEERGRRPNGHAYTVRRHGEPGGKPIAEHWVVHGAGHAWSGGNPKGSYTDAGGPDATGEMLRFFFAHTLLNR